MRDADVLQRLLATQGEKTSQELESRTARNTAYCEDLDADNAPADIQAQLR